MKANQDRTGSKLAGSAKTVADTPPAPPAPSFESFEADRQQPHMLRAASIAKHRTLTAAQAVDKHLTHLYDAVALLSATEDRLDWPTSDKDELHCTLRLCQMAKEKVAQAADAFFHVFEQRQPEAASRS